MSSFHSLPSALERRRQDLDRLASTSGGVTRYSVFITVTNPGELVQPVAFPVTFTEKPVFYWGVEADPNTLVADGSYPIVTPIVRSWTFGVHKETGYRWYNGANILIVTTGLSTQTLIVQCHFEAMAVRGPTG